MCKILVMPGIKDSNREMSLKLIKKMSDNMSEMNRDGLGYSALTSDGKLFGERWWYNYEAFNVREESLDGKLNLVDEFGGFLSAIEMTKKYNQFGVGHKGLDSIAAITMHTRMATTGKEFINTHPFISEDGQTTLIHNGMINNHSKLTKRYSTCDSEVLLNLYDDTGIFDDFSRLEEDLVKKVYGYYACAVLSQTSEGQHILDVFKDTDAVLGGAFIKELDTYAITTKIDDLEKACKDLGLSIVQKYKINDDRGVRIDPFSGKVIQKVSFKSIGRVEPYEKPNYNHGTYTNGEWESLYGKKEETGSNSSGGTVSEIGKGEHMSKGGQSQKDFPKSDLTLEQAVESEENTKKYVFGKTDDELIADCHTFLNRCADRNRTWNDTADGNHLLKQLRTIKKQDKVNKIVDALTGDPYHWEEYKDAETNEWFFKRTGTGRE